MFSFAAFGNDLASGRRSIDFVGRRRLWYAIASTAVLVSIIGLGVRGLNAGIEFRGGSEFTVSNVSTTNTHLAENAVRSADPNAEQPRVSVVGGGSSIRVETGKLSDQQTDQVKESLAKAYGVADT